MEPTGSAPCTPEKDRGSTLSSSAVRHCQPLDESSHNEHSPGRDDARLVAGERARRQQEATAASKARRKARRVEHEATDSASRRLETLQEPPSSSTDNSARQVSELEVSIELAPGERWRAQGALPQRELQTSNELAATGAGGTAGGQGMCRRNGILARCWCCLSSTLRDPHHYGPAPIADGAAVEAQLSDKPHRPEVAETEVETDHNRLLQVGSDLDVSLDAAPESDSGATISQSAAHHGPQDAHSALDVALAAGRPHGSPPRGLAGLAAKGRRGRSSDFVRELPTSEESPSSTTLSGQHNHPTLGRARRSPLLRKARRKPNATTLSPSRCNSANPCQPARRLLTTPPRLSGASTDDNDKAENENEAEDTRYSKEVDEDDNEDRHECGTPDATVPTTIDPGFAATAAMWQQRVQKTPPREVSHFAAGEASEGHWKLTDPNKEEMVAREYTEESAEGTEQVHPSMRPVRVRIRSVGGSPAERRAQARDR